MRKMIKVDIAELFPPERRAQFRNCVLIAPQSVIDTVRITAPDNSHLRENYHICINNADFKGHLKFLLGSGTGRVDINGAGPINISVRMWRTSSLKIGAGTTITDARFVCDDADVIVGEDGLWSDQILVQSNDQHGIVDLETGEVINAGRRQTVIGDHVWIGRQATLMPDVDVGNGSILATGAVLTSNMDSNSIFAGVPARKIRNGVSWSRNPGGFSQSERDFFQGQNKE